MAESYGSLPFQEQIDFFRGKLNLPTQRWDDLFGAAHDRAFVVAGAMQADLLADLRGAVQTAIERGTSLQDFRAQFEEIVARHGWTGWTGEKTEAGRAWRAEIIYNTNLRTSWAAGRWQQLQSQKKKRPYWRYRHNDTVRHPRPHHVALDGLILHADDPFWQTAYPPSGFNCFPAGTKVATPHGWRAIETLGRGDCVIGGSGDVKPVTAPHQRAFHENLVRIVAEEIEVSATPNHRFLTLRGWIRAENLQVGEVLVQVGEVAAIDVAVEDVEQPDSARCQTGVALPFHRLASTLRETFNADVQTGNEGVDPVRRSVVVMDSFKAPLLQRVQHRLLSLRGGGFSVGMRSRVISVSSAPCFSHLRANLWAPRGSRYPQLFSGASNPFVRILGLSKPWMATFCRLLEGGLAHCFGRNLPALVASDPLGFDGIAPVSWLNAEPLHEAHNGAVIKAPSLAQLPESEALVDVEGGEGFASGAPLDRFDSLENFVGWARAHCKLSVVSSVSIIPYNGTVYNLSVEKDESYCVKTGVVHNCRCYVESLSAAQMKREGLKVGTAPTDFQPDKGWDYAPGASVADELGSIITRKAASLPSPIARHWLSDMLERVGGATWSVVKSMIQSLLSKLG